MKSVSVFALVCGLALSALGAPTNNGNPRNECLADADCTAPRTCSPNKKGDKYFCMFPKQVNSPQETKPDKPEQPQRTECSTDAECTVAPQTACTPNKAGTKSFCMKPKRIICTEDADCSVAGTSCVANKAGNKSFCRKPKQATPEKQEKPQRTECSTDAECTVAPQTACTPNKAGTKSFCMKPKRIICTEDADCSVAGTSCVATKNGKKSFCEASTAG